MPFICLNDKCMSLEHKKNGVFMVSHFFSSGLVLILLFLSGCGGQKVSTVEDEGKNAITEQKDLIREHIADAEKQAKLLKVIDEVNIESGIYFAFYERHIEKVAGLAKNHHATREEFQTVLDDFNMHYERYLLMLVRKREEMRLLTTEEEWTKIMNRETSFIPG